jgi:hypothetical protein
LTFSFSFGSILGMPLLAAGSLKRQGREKGRDLFMTFAFMVLGGFVIPYRIRN